MNEASIQRHLCGIVGFAMLVTGGLFCYRDPHQISFFAAVAVRAGLLLMVVWLAWPQLLRWSANAPRLLTTTAAGLAVVLIVRPNLARLVIAAGSVLLVYTFVANWLRSMSRRD